MLIVFDWDGTLCDSTGRIVQAMQAAARVEAVEIPAAGAVREIIGLGLPEAMVELFPELPAAEREQLQVRYSEAYRDVDREPAPLFPGVPEALESLRARGHRLTVATGKGRAGLDRVLGGLGMSDYFDATRCADETRSKPHPLMLNELLEELTADPTESVMVGDSEYDLMMALAAGVESVGVSYGVHATERLRRQTPRAVIDHIDELIDLLSRPA